jgi:hypothetical protein
VSSGRANCRSLRTATQESQIKEARIGTSSLLAQRQVGLWAGRSVIPFLQRVEENNDMKIFLVLTALLVINAMSQSLKSGYRGIVPVKSTRADVERLLGPPTDSERQTYYFADEIVSFQYSRYGCNAPPAIKGWPIPPVEGWNVPPDTVLVVRVNLRKQVPLSMLAIDLKGFEKIRGDRDVPSHFRYVNKETGVTIDLNGDGAKEVVSGFVYEPEAKYEDLRCSQTP